MRVRETTLLKLNYLVYSNSVSKDTALKDFILKLLKLYIEDARHQIWAVCSCLASGKLLLDLLPARIVGKRNKEVQRAVVARKSYSV